MGYGIVRVSATTPTKIISENCKRKILWITNASLNSSIAYGPDDSITSLNAGGLLYPYQVFENKKDFGDWKGDIYGITLDSVGSAIVYYWEVESNL